MNIYSLTKVVHLVLGEPTISSDHVLEPPGHAVDEVLEVGGVVHPGHPVLRVLLGDDQNPEQGGPRHVQLLPNRREGQPPPSLTPLQRFSWRWRGVFPSSEEHAFSKSLTGSLQIYMIYGNERTDKSLLCMNL